LFRSSNRSIAAFATPPHRLVATAEHPGVIEVEARFGDATALATVEVAVTAVEGADGISSDARRRLDGAPESSPALSPRFVYPEPEVVIPRNLAPMTFQWDASAPPAPT